jgi:hypothetical protein
MAYVVDLFKKQTGSVERILVGFAQDCVAHDKLSSAQLASRKLEHFSDEDAMIGLKLIEGLANKTKFKFSHFYEKTGTIRTRFIDTCAKIEENSVALLADEIDRIVKSNLARIVEPNEETFGFAFLNSSEKSRIHINIEKIRKLIEESPLTDRKKNALFDRLNDLSDEVDRVGTRTDAFFAFLSDAAFVAGEMAKKAKPFTDEVKDMIKTVGRSRARQEGTSLPPGDEVLKLPSPKDGEE